jgi:ParB family chromosome partitioning protein
VTPSRFQPRRAFDESSLEQLAASIKNAGVMQPIAVRPIDPRAGAPAGVAWELVAGERRWRAAQLAGLSHVPAVVFNATDREAAEWGIIENVQREDLNPIEAAHAYRNLQREFGLTQSEIAQRVGVDRSTVANIMRLTELEAAIQSMIEAGVLSLGHAKALLSISGGEAREALAVRARDEGWSVRMLEQEAIAARDGEAPSSTSGTEGGGSAGSSAAPATSANLSDLEKRLGEHLGTRVRVKLGASKKKGRIEIEFYDLDQFDGILTTIGFREASVSAD